jgi:salicylate hydroxylase
MKPDILIVGAGIGGLVAALALHQEGFPVRVFEQAPVLGDIGAGLTLSRGALRVLTALGLQEPVRRIATHTRDMAFLHYRTGAVLAGAPDYTDGSDMPAAPAALHIHRADLHRMLVDALAERAPGSLFAGHRLTSLEQKGERVTANFTNGASAEADALVGADGVRSRVRQCLWGEDGPDFTGQVAYRCLIPGNIAAPCLGAGRAAVYIGPGQVLNRYTIRRNSLLNCVGIVRTGQWVEDGWSTPATAAEMGALYADWHPDVSRLIALAPAGGLIKWGIFNRPALAQWRQGQVAVLGDAAHPMVPFLGLGAAMAIEDGIVLALAMARSGSVAEGFDRFQEARRERTAQIAALSQKQGDLVQAQSPDTYAHDAAPAGNASLYDFDLDTVLAPATLKDRKREVLF